jgi:hypothetical protein
MGGTRRDVAPNGCTALQAVKRLPSGADSDSSGLNRPQHEEGDL